jgi:hypothetical protein
MGIEHEAEELGNWGAEELRNVNEEGRTKNRT